MMDHLVHRFKQKSFNRNLNFFKHMKQMHYKKELFKMGSFKSKLALIKNKRPSEVLKLVLIEKTYITVHEILRIGIA